MTANRRRPISADELPSFRGLYVLASLVASLTIVDLLLWTFGLSAWRQPFGISLSLLAALIGGSRIVFGALSALLAGKAGADLALAIATLAAIALGEYWVAAEVVVIALVGESLEALAISRAYREIHRMLDLRPLQARVRRGDQELEIPAENLTVGDVVVIRPGERIAIDGTVLAGRTTIDQSTLTGESLPIDKSVGDPVYAGSLNQFGSVDVRAEVVGAETTLGRVLQFVADARRNKAPIERTADRLARVFLPFVLVCAALVFVSTNLTVLGFEAGNAVSSWTWMPTLSVLVVSCPCALILATPAATMAATAWLARRGVLIKGGAVLERLAEIDRFAFDKTGTLTSGNLQLGEVLPFGSSSATDVIQLAATAEQKSEHLIARLVVAEAKRRELSLDPLVDFLALPGAGVSGSIERDGRPRRVQVGSPRLAAEDGIAISAEIADAVAKLESSGQSPLLVCFDGAVIGAIGVRDSIRPEAAKVLAGLAAIGVRDVVMLTGDRQARAESIANELGIRRFGAELRPEDKARWLSQWRDERRTFSGPKPVAMVGDGVNDAPALAIADVGIAIGSVGSNLAAEAGDIILMGDPLTPLPSVVRIARQTLRIIEQNIIAFAFVFNLVGIVWTAWILPGWSEEWMQRAPVAAAIFHQFGSVLVILNSMRLLWFERWEESPAGRLESSLASAMTTLWQPIAGFVFLWRRLPGFRWQALKLAAALAFAVYFLFGLVAIPLDEVGIQCRCGRFVGILPPGLHFCLPPPFDVVTREKIGRIRTVEIGVRRGTARGAAAPIDWNTAHGERTSPESIVLTGDQSLAELAAVVQYRILDAARFRFGAKDSERLLRTLAECFLREESSRRPLLAEAGMRTDDELLTQGRSRLASDVRDRLQRECERLRLGIEIPDGGVCLLDVHPPVEVVEAFRDVSRAYKERERMENEADARHRDLVIKAGGLSAWQLTATGAVEIDDAHWRVLRPNVEGEAAAELSSAQSFADSQRELAIGESSRFIATQSAANTNADLAAWRLWLEATTESLPGKRKIVVDASARGRKHLILGEGRKSIDDAALPPLLLNPEPER